MRQHLTPRIIFGQRSVLQAIQATLELQWERHSIECDCWVDICRRIAPIPITILNLTCGEQIVLSPPVAALVNFTDVPPTIICFDE